MYPLLKHNDMVIVAPLSAERLKTGNIVVFKKDAPEYIVHRLVKRTGGGKMLFRGDGYNLPLELIGTNAVVGKVTGRIRAGELIRVSRSKECGSWAIAMIKERVKRLLMKGQRVVQEDSTSVSDYL